MTYIVFDRYTDNFRAFRLEGGSYRELIGENKLWLPDVRLGLGLWYETYQGIERLWLRWYDARGNWVSTEVEQERQRADRLEAELRALRGESQ